MKFFSKQTPEDLARQELEVQKRNLLTHESDAVYNTKMAEYARIRIASLEDYLNLDKKTDSSNSKDINPIQ